MVKSAYAQIVEWAHNAKEDNKNQYGLYLIGVESSQLVYGFSERENIEEARAELTSKGYIGKTLEARLPKPENWVGKIMTL